MVEIIFFSIQDDFFKQRTGLIVLYSLKNPAFYETKIETETGCMSLDFHGEKPYLIVAGFYDGTVNVFDIRNRSKKEPKFLCTSKNGKHKDPVWQVNEFY